MPRSRNPQPAEVRMWAAARASGEVVWPSELVEYSIESVEQSLYY